MYYKYELISSVLLKIILIFLESGIMRASIHPEYNSIIVTCSCGNKFETGSTLGHNLGIEVCSQCHPFYTGKQKLIDTGGRVQKFRDRYSIKKTS